MFVFFSRNHCVLCEILRLKIFGLVTSFEAKEEEKEEYLLINLRRTNSAFYRLGCCYVLVDRVYKPNCEEMSLEISPMLKDRDLCFLDNCQLLNQIFS